MSERPTAAEVFMGMAELAASRSTCMRRKVGCLLTDERGEKIWIGYNGSWRGGPNECVGHPDRPGGCGCVHAELNAVAKVDQPGAKHAYVTVQPCVMCAQVLVNAQVVAVTFREPHRHAAGLEVLRDAGVRLCETRA